MKQFLLFAGDDYYPAGGWDDFIASFDLQKEAEDFMYQCNTRYDWYHIIDITQINTWQTKTLRL